MFSAQLESVGQSFVDRAALIKDQVIKSLSECISNHKSVKHQVREREFVIRIDSIKVQL